MKFIFDLDDTICRTKNRDYANSEVITGVVDNIRRLKQTIPNARIVIHTARGMASCEGDSVKAEKKNRNIIENWLKQHDVPYDAIIFGKPLGDVYVDDKAMSARSFATSTIKELSGFSGARVVRIGGVVVKETDNAEQQARWYEEARAHYTTVGVPIVNSVTLGRIYMEYVEGVCCARVVNREILHELLSLLLSEKVIEGENDLEGYASYVLQRASSLGIVTDLPRKIVDCKLLKEKTFCHGDLSLLNIIVNDAGLHFIDPGVNPFVNSWIVDAAKIRFSLSALDEALEGVKHDKSLLVFFDRCLPKKYLDAIMIVEESHVIRVLYYARKNNKRKVEQILTEYGKRTFGWR